MNSFDLLPRPVCVDVLQSVKVDIVRNFAYLALSLPPSRLRLAEGETRQTES